MATTKFQEIPELIDEGTATLTQILHRHKVDPMARKHLERALTHLREAWLAQDGQQARTPAQLMADFAEGETLLAQVEAGATEVMLGKTKFKVHPSEA